LRRIERGAVELAIRFVAGDPCSALPLRFCFISALDEYDEIFSHRFFGLATVLYRKGREGNLAALINGR
jgi:hypothetical protein